MTEIDSKAGPNKDDADWSGRVKRGVMGNQPALLDLFRCGPFQLPTRPVQLFLVSIRLSHIPHDDGHLYGQYRLLSAKIAIPSCLSSIQEAH